MVRTREFDEDSVIEQAMMAFLEAGPSSTSLAKLEAATGVGRKSLYNTFGNKHGLLIKAIEKFQDASTVRFIEPLEEPGAGRAHIENVVWGMVEYMTVLTRGDGCLLCVSAQDPVNSSKQVAALVDGYFIRARKGFLKCVKRGIRQGEITSEASPSALADFFVGVLMGISTLTRTGASAKSISRFAEVSLSTLD